MTTNGDFKNFNIKSEADKSKGYNEDIAFSLDTFWGKLFILLDFATHTYPSLDGKLKHYITNFVKSLDARPGISPRLFLGLTATEINNIVLDIGRTHCGGKLFSVAALGLLAGKEFYYLTYGDARINVYDGGKLLLLNGTRYYSSLMVETGQGNPISFDEDPEQLGRHYIESLVYRVYSIALQDSDVILMFSDGLEKTTTPQMKLKMLQDASSSNLSPANIADSLFDITKSAQDDRAVIVICGPYPSQVNAELESAFSKVSALERNIGAQEKSEAEAREKLRQNLLQELQRNANSIKTVEQNLNNKLVVKIDEARARQIANEAVRNKISEMKLELSQQGQGNKDSLYNDPATFWRFFQDQVKKHPGMWNSLVASTSPSSSSSPENQPSGAPLPKTISGNKLYTIWVEAEQIVVKSTDTNSQIVYGTEFKVEDINNKAVLDIMNGGSNVGMPYNEAINYLKRNRKLKGKAREFFLGPGPVGFALSRVLICIVLGFSLAYAVGMMRGGSGGDKDESKGKTTSASDTKTSDPGQTSSSNNSNTNKPEIVLQEASLVDVQPGDTLEKIARRYTVTQDQLRKQNPEIMDWSTIKPGQKIKIPYAGTR